MGAFSRPGETFEYAEASLIEEEAQQGRERAEAMQTSVQSSTRTSDQAMALIRAGLRANLDSAREVYLKLGMKLDTPGELSRSDRAAYVEGRRILEQVWGLNLLRDAPRPEQDKNAIVKSPILKTGTLYPQATVAFDTRRVPRGRGLFLTRMKPRETFYGPDGPINALRNELAALQVLGQRYQKEYAHASKREGEGERVLKKWSVVDQRVELIKKALADMKQRIPEVDRQIQKIPTPNSRR